MGTIFCHHTFPSGVGRRRRQKRVKMVAFALLAVLAIASSATASREDLPSCYELSEAGGKCKAKLDIQILLDSSGSVPLKDFKNILKLLADKFVPEFDIGPDGTHVAVTSFGGDKPGVVRADIRLGQHKTAAALKKAIKAIKKINRLTPTQKALKNSLKSFLKKDRADADNVLLIFTDGNPTIGPKFPRAAARAWAAVASVYAIGFGQGIERSVLNVLANGEKDNVYLVQDVEAILEIIETLIQKSCSKDKKTNCTKCRAKAMMLNTATEEEGYVPVCTKKNGFKAVQCLPGGKTCFCARHKNGMEIPGTRGPAKSVNNKKCVAARKAWKAAQIANRDCVKRQSGKGFKPACNAQGYYKTKQCLKKLGFCWCSLRDGTALPNTIYHKSTPRKNRPKCNRLRDTRFTCKGEGFYKHPFDDHRFIKCGSGRAFACSCPADNVFSSKLGICVFKP